jgi:hypothetical protein
VILAKLDASSAAIFADVLRLAFNPNQPRDYRGRWAKVGSSEERSTATPANRTLAQAPPLVSGPKHLPDWNTPTNPSVRDSKEHWNDLGSYPKGFTLSFQFRFPNHPSGTNWIRPLPSPKTPNVPVPRRVSYFGNSGVYIYDAMEVQIIDQNSIDGLGKRILVSGTGPGTKVEHLGYEPEAANTLVTGIPYGVGTVKFTNGGKPVNNLRPPGQWNDMTVKFVPKYATNPQTNQPDTGKLTGGSITVTLNGKETFQGFASKGTGNTRSKIPLADVSDRDVYLQAHYGSAVSFRHIEISAPPSPRP